VQPLAYSHAPTDTVDDDRRRLPAGFALLTIVVGAAMLLGHGWSLLADCTGWSDPFYRKFRTQGITIGVPSIAVMISVNAAHLLAAALQLAGGIGCIGRPRPWARVVLLAYALLASTALVTGYVCGWIARQAGRANYSQFESAGQVLIQTAYATAALGLPLLTLLLVRPRSTWPIRHP
jgi:hypothetical protein